MLTRKPLAITLAQAIDRSSKIEAPLIRGLPVGSSPSRHRVLQETQPLGKAERREKVRPISSYYCKQQLRQAYAIPFDQPVLLMVAPPTSRATVEVCEQLVHLGVYVLVACPGNYAASNFVNAGAHVVFDVGNTQDGPLCDLYRLSDAYLYSGDTESCPLTEEPSHIFYSASFPKTSPNPDIQKKPTFIAKTLTPDTPARRALPWPVFEAMNQGLPVFVASASPFPSQDKPLGNLFAGIPGCHCVEEACDIVTTLEHWDRYGQGSQAAPGILT